MTFVTVVAGNVSDLEKKNLARRHDAGMCRCQPRADDARRKIRPDLTSVLYDPRIMQCLTITVHTTFSITQTFGHRLDSSITLDAPDSEIDRLYNAYLTS